MLKGSHCLQKVSGNSKYTACLCPLKARSCTKGGQELNYLPTALFCLSLCSPKLRSRTGRALKSFFSTQSWMNKAPLSCTDSRECWRSPISPAVHLSLAQCQAWNFLGEFGEGGKRVLKNKKIKINMFGFSNPRRTLGRSVRNVLCCWTLALGGAGAACMGVMSRVVRGLQAEVQTLAAHELS